MAQWQTNIDITVLECLIHLFRFCQSLSLQLDGCWILNLALQPNHSNLIWKAKLIRLVALTDDIFHIRFLERLRSRRHDERKSLHHDKRYSSYCCSPLVENLWCFVQTGFSVRRKFSSPWMALSFTPGYNHIRARLSSRPKDTPGEQHLREYCHHCPSLCWYTGGLWSFQQLL